MLSRTARLSKPAESGPPKEQDIPLKVPKKTKLYVEQVRRRRGGGGGGACAAVE